MSKELTDAQIEKIDKIHNIAYRAMAELLGFELDEDYVWDMEWIGELADAMTEIAVEYFDRDEMEIYPYVEGVL